MGHALPASFFLGFGVFFLVLTYKRCRDLAVSTGGGTTGTTSTSRSTNHVATFCDRHVPERSITLLRRVGILLLIVTTLGGIYEAMGAYYDPNPNIGIFHQLAHEALYLCFFFVGAVALLESRGLLMADSSRIALSVAFGLQYVLWNEHGLMKTDMSDRRVHLLQAQVNLVAAASFGYSVYNPRSLLAYLAGWAVMVLNALWMLTAGLTVCCVDLMAHTVGAALALETLLVAAVVVAAAACCPYPGGGHGGGEGLHVSAVDDDEKRSYEQVSLTDNA